MSTLIVGDVHGCADELERLLDEVDADEVVFVGDLYTKGPDPGGVHALVKPHRGVLGNHDVRVLERRPSPRIRRVWDALDRVDPEWRAWLAAWPRFSSVGRFTVVHAYLDDGGAESTDANDAVIRRFRRDLPGSPLWWTVYDGPPVVFGHDAQRGLVRVERQGLPWVIGLDSGCVYGGHLTGYIVEEDRLVHVRARRSYVATG